MGFGSKNSLEIGNLMTDLWQWKEAKMSLSPSAGKLMGDMMWDDMAKEFVSSQSVMSNAKFDDLFIASAGNSKIFWAEKF